MLHQHNFHDCYMKEYRYNYNLFQSTLMVKPDINKYRMYHMFHVRNKLNYIRRGILHHMIRPYIFHCIHRMEQLVLVANLLNNFHVHYMVYPSLPCRGTLYYNLFLSTRIHIDTRVFDRTIYMNHDHYTFYHSL